MMLTLHRLLIRHWPLVLTFWVGLLITLRWAAPAWDEITKDGDFQYLPDESPSVVGQETLSGSFPELAMQSHLVGIVARPAGNVAPGDVYVAYDLSRRLHLMAGISQLGQSRVAAGDNEDTLKKKLEFAQKALANLNRTISLTQELYQFKAVPDDTAAAYFDSGTYDPLALALYNRSLVYTRLGEQAAADEDLANAKDIDPALAELQGSAFPAEFLELPISKIWSWQTEGIGPALMRIKGKEAVARLLVIHLDTEFLAVGNVGLFEIVQRELEAVEAWTRDQAITGLDLSISGSAAVGSDLLLASADSVRNTEWFTLILVTIILITVYRSPLLVIVPLVTIGVSLDIALHTLALISQIEGPSGPYLSLFKTTKIFIVVILFGTGTDFCLFLISRLRENGSKFPDHQEALSQSLNQVSVALIASALTTILGLGTMIFASFGKLSNSGPAIGMALSVTLLACLTLTPALLAAFGKTVFWSPRIPGLTAMLDSLSRSSQKIWDRVAYLVVRYPGSILSVALILLAVPAIHGQASTQRITYDLLAGLDSQRPSREGTEVLKQYFPIGESGPVMVLAKLPGTEGRSQNDEAIIELQDKSSLLATRIESIEGVDYVRSLQAPLGHRGKPSDPTQQVMRSLPSVQSLFISVPGDTESPWVVKFDVVLKSDLFSLNSTETLNEISTILEELAADPDSAWYATRFDVAGTTAAIRDLRTVTRKDTSRIQFLVVIVVFTVLVVILKHPVICAYMIFSVLLSFLVTVGVTDWLFAFCYQDGYPGLEWKVPLFLFVILVAVGEDYNVYLASRVFEEQRKHGPIRGLRTAITKTGGIITSCGIIMAGTFVTMTSPVWYTLVPPQLEGIKEWLRPEGGSLQGMIQMGFALTLGVLLDTFIVRPVLLPAYLALVVRWQAWRATKGRLKIQHS